MTEEELEKLFKEIEEEEKEIRNLKDLKNENIRKIETSKNKFEELKRNILPKLLMDIDSFNQLEKEISNKKIPSLKKLLEEEENEEQVEIIKTLKKKIYSYEKELNTLKKDAQLLQTTVNEIKDKIANLGGKKIKQQKETVESITREINELSSKTTTGKVQIKKCKKIDKKFGG